MAESPTGSSRFKCGSADLSPDLDEIFAPRNWFKTTATELCGMGAQLAGDLGVGAAIPYTGSTTSLIQEHCSATNWKCVSQARYTSYGLKEDGTLWSWGYNLLSTLGVGDENQNGYINSPVQEIYNSTNWCEMIVGIFNAGGVKSDGSLWLWGSNRYGELAIGVPDVTEPCACACPLRECTSSTNWWKGAGSFGAIYALKTDGTMWTWGYNLNGALPLNKDGTCSYSSPTREVSSSSNWCNVAAGESNGSAIKTDGTLWTWGFGTVGQIGNNTTQNASSPTQEFCSAVNWCHVSVGCQTVSGIKTDGTMWVWGANQCGMLGIGNTTNVAFPNQEGWGYSDWVCSASGKCNTAALKADGTMWIAGLNDVCQLGVEDLLYCTNLNPYGAGNNWRDVSLQRSVGTTKILGLFSNDTLDFTP